MLPAVAGPRYRSAAYVGVEAVEKPQNGKNQQNKIDLKQ